MAWGTKGSEPGQLNYPRGVAANGSEGVVSDDDNHRIQVFNAEGAYLASAGREGSGPGQFGFTYGVPLVAAGNFYVSDDLNLNALKLSTSLALFGACGHS